MTSFKYKKAIRRSNGSVPKQVFSGLNQPRFRQNGYEVNGDKKPFALGLDNVNSEFLNFEDYKPFNTWGDVDLEIPIYIDTNGNPEVFYGVWHYGSILASPISERNKLRVLARTDVGSISVNLQKNGVTVFSSNVTGKFINGIFDTTIKIKNGILYADGVLIEDFSSYNSEDLTPLFTSFFTNRIGMQLNNSGVEQYYNGILKPFSLNNENFPLTVGLGGTTTGSNGTVATIETSASQAKDRINYGMWLKGNDVDGWTPYTKQ